MALVLKDRVQETTATTGTGTVTLAGAVLGFQSFAAIGNANTTYYCIAGRGTGEWEVGVGTYTASGTTLARTTVLASSNAGSLVSFSAGTKDVFGTYPAGAAVSTDASGNVGIGTSGPSAKFEVSGPALGTTAGNTVELYRITNANSNTNILRFYQIRTSAGTDWTTAATRIQARTDAADQAFIQFNGANTGGLAFGVGSTNYWTLSSAGRVYLTTSASRGTSGYPVISPNDSVANALRASGYIEWQTDVGAIGTNYFLSDVSKKENIAPCVFDSSALLSRVNFISFDWKPESGNSGHVDVGVSAQQLQTLDPRLVNALSDGTLMVNEPALVAHMAKAIQELTARVAALEAR